MRERQIYSIEEVARILGCRTFSIKRPQDHIQNLAFDTRKLRYAEQSLFFALPGLRDGHDFIAHGIEQGVRNLVISDKDKFQVLSTEDLNVLLVDDTMDAIQVLAAYHRSQFDYPVIGITGSNGKTIVKDWMFQLLSPERKIVRSPKSYNSQLGVALSLWEMDDGFDLAIIEAGISKAGEMDKLAAMIQPDIGILTSIGAAHQEGFQNTAQKAAEKWKLLQPAPLRIFSQRSAEHLQHPSVNTSNEPFENWTWGDKEGATQDHKLFVLGQQRVLHQGRTFTEIEAEVEDAGRRTKRSIRIPFTDSASVQNACTCWLAAIYLGLSHQQIAERMSNLQNMEMRLQLKQGVNRCEIIDDSYSNDLSSLAIALDFLKQQQKHPHKTLILSDIPQISGVEEKVYQQVADLLKEHRIDSLITVGAEFLRRRGQFPVGQHQVYSSTEALIQDLPALNLRDQCILLKGARAYAFERLTAKLVAQSHETTMEINMSALEHNVRHYQTTLGPKVKLMVMVKAFSYGSGSYEVASRLQWLGVDYLAVAYADEGVALRESGITLPIMVMNPDPLSFDALYDHSLEPELFSFSILKDWFSFLQSKIGHTEVSQAASQAPSQTGGYPVHIKLDTGMHRLGFEAQDLDELADFLKQQDLIRVCSVFSHLASAGNPEHDGFTRGQIQRLMDFAQALKRAAMPKDQDFMVHIANTDGIARFPEARLDMVRLGIGLYGLRTQAIHTDTHTDTHSDTHTDTHSDTQKHIEPAHLEPAIQLKSSITQLRWVPAGESVGYNLRGRSDQKRLIATVRIGYADGYDRRLGNSVGQMQVRGQLLPTVGDICMDMCMLDVTPLADDIQVGEEVLVYGGKADVVELAERIGTIPYELLVNISQRVKRVYFYG